MTTAEEMIKNAFPDWHDWPDWAVEGTIQVMREYAKQVAQDVLYEAANNAIAILDFNDMAQIAIVDRESITDTEIITP